jgi:cytoskeletal protein RodZ
MKKYIALTLCFILCACMFAACKKEPPAPTETDTSTAAQTDGTTTEKEAGSSETQSTGIPDETQSTAASDEEDTNGAEDTTGETVSAKAFLGAYRNSDYTVNVEQAPDGELTFTVTGKPDGNVGYEWTITGYYSGDTYRVNYKDAVKEEITYGEDGAETSRKTVYGNGIGRMQFTEDGALLWEDETEAAGGRIVLNRVRG